MEPQRTLERVGELGLLAVVRGESADAALEVARRAREGQEALEARVAALEATTAEQASAAEARTATHKKASDEGQRLPDVPCGRRRGGRRPRWSGTR